MTLCRAGKHKDALKVLRTAVKSPEFAKNAEMWNCLGLAFFADSDIKRARKAFDAAVELEPKSALYKTNLAQVLLAQDEIDAAQSQLDSALRIDPTLQEALYLSATAMRREGKLKDAIAIADKLIDAHRGNVHGYLLKADLLVAQVGDRPPSDRQGSIDLLQRALKVLNAADTAAGEPQEKKRLAEEKDAVSTFLEYFERSKDPAVDENKKDDDPGVTRLKILSKSRAEYTDEARNRNVQGTIWLLVLFGANGKVEHVIIQNRLGYGLDENAIKAVKAIRFEPERRNDVAVSTVRKVSFSFSTF